MHAVLFNGHGGLDKLEYRSYVNWIESTAFIHETKNGLLLEKIIN